MQLKDFHFHLPPELIAQHPLHRRDHARLMIINITNGIIQHDIFGNIGKYLPEQSCLVVNNSKVIRARLLTRRKSGAEVEIFLLRSIDNEYSYEVMMRPLRRLKLGEKFSFCNGELIAEIISKDNPVVRFNRKDVETFLERTGHIPLPPYINRKDTAEDKKYYQTVYAQHYGSVAAPTAGLHFTERLLNKLKNAGHSREDVTLHINYGTFKPVEEEDITKHKIHTESYFVEKAAWERIKEAKEDHRRIVAVGTTACRVLETIAGSGKLSGDTDIFIYPGYKFRITDALITNFHLPCSTLLMLVSALAGRELIMKAYKEAVKAEYRFFSYGDAMLIKS
jgi:S-adenosylmethionine:tRNA ribosyltransferase-isomerase